VYVTPSLIGQCQLFGGINYTTNGIKQLCMRKHYVALIAQKIH
jgi:hypothetical protein